jgi:hypothetical protein
MNRYVGRQAGACAGLAALALAALGAVAGPIQADPRPAMTWSGDVDDTTLIYFHGSDVRTRDIFGKASNQTSAQVLSRLPRGPIQVFLARWAGRGQVRVVQQPTPDNDFTAAVRVHDPQPGRGRYDFALAWAPLPGAPGFGDRDFNENLDRNFHRDRPSGYRVRPENFDPPADGAWVSRDRR